jgi:hypothetical protein
LSALEEGIPITDPKFYSSETQCPDSLIAHVFRAAPDSVELLPLLNERIAIMREVGAILCNVSFSIRIRMHLDSLRVSCNIGFRRIVPRLYWSLPKKT